MNSLTAELKSIHSQIEDLEISEETASALYRVYIRSTQNWASRSLDRIEHDVKFDNRHSAEFEALGDYMEGSVFEFPLGDIIEIYFNAQERIRGELGFGNQFQFASKNGLISTLQVAKTRHLRFETVKS